MRLALIPLLVLTAMPVNAQHYHATQTREYGECTKIREIYVPGSTINGSYRRGYIRTERIKVSCSPLMHGRVYRENRIPYHEESPSVDNNDCSGGTAVGALLGGGLAGFGSRGKDRWWAIPAGVVGGAMLGCQVDGG